MNSRPLLVATRVGLFSLIEARYRSVNTPSRNGR